MLHPKRKKQRLDGKSMSQSPTVKLKPLNRQTQVVQPAKLNKVPLIGTRALTHLNPFNPSVSQSDNTSTSPVFGAGA